MRGRLRRYEIRPLHSRVRRLARFLGHLRLRRMRMGAVGTRRADRLHHGQHEWIPSDGASTESGWRKQLTENIQTVLRSAQEEGKSTGKAISVKTPLQSASSRNMALACTTSRHQSPGSKRDLQAVSDTSLSSASRIPSTRVGGRKSQIMLHGVPEPIGQPEVRPHRAETTG